MLHGVGNQVLGGWQFNGIWTIHSGFPFQVGQGNTLNTFNSPARPDRLASSVADLLRIVEDLKARGVTVRILSMNVDTTNATGLLILQVLGAVADLERNLMLERQRDGFQRGNEALVDRVWQSSQQPVCLRTFSISSVGHCNPLFLL